MIRSFVEVLHKQLREDIDNYSQDVAGGCCQTFDEYKGLCGRIQGLRRAEEYLLALAKKAETDE